MIVVKGATLQQEKHERKIHFCGGPQKEGKLKSSHHVTTFS
ncbi:hypothetical protein [Lysinibacillus sp. 54212]